MGKTTIARPFKKGGPAWNKGIHISEEHRLNVIKNTARGEKSHFWKGDKVKYRALHHWVRTAKGDPLKCEFCGKVKTTPKSIQWANKSNKYKREESDWIQLCASCHQKHDKDYRIKLFKKYGNRGAEKRVGRRKGRLLQKFELDRK